VVLGGVPCVVSASREAHTDDGAAALLPALVYVHGGGFTVGSPASHQELVDNLQYRAGGAYVTVSVDYRLAPEVSRL
jgi:acetyl esterase